MGRLEEFCQKSQSLKSENRENENIMYDFLLVGSGLFNAVFANEVKKEEKNAL